ncbi:MAG: hypothetical protein VYD03_00150 [Pseudomonadota bacterium]|nr:hypothetical protein [Pseudomonadota bacterium]
MTDQELHDLVASFASERQYIQQLQANSERLQASTERQLAKITTQLAATDAQLAATDAQLQANAVQQAQTEAKLNRTAEKIDRLAERYGGVSNSQGAVAEEFYYNSLKDKPVLIGMNFDSIYKNIAGNRHGVEDEFDLVLVNRDNVFVLEIKYKAHPRDLARLLEKKRSNFNTLLPQYKDHTQHSGLAAFHLPDEVKHAALARGIHLLQRKGNVIQTVAA